MLYDYFFNKAKCINTVFIFLISFGVIACNYHWVGSNPKLPGNARSIAVLPVENNTYQSELDTRLIRNLRKLFQENDEVIIRPSSDADLLLKVALNTLKTKQTSLSSDGLTVELQLELIGSVSVEDRRKKRILWSEKSLSAKTSLSYDKGEEVRGLTFATLGRGIKKITTEFSNRIYERLFFDF